MSDEFKAGPFEMEMVKGALRTRQHEIYARPVDWTSVDDRRLREVFLQRAGEDP